MKKVAKTSMATDIYLRHSWWGQIEKLVSHHNRCTDLVSHHEGPCLDEMECASWPLGFFRSLFVRSFVRSFAQRLSDISTSFWPAAAAAAVSFRFLRWLIVIGGSLRIISVCKQAAARQQETRQRERERRKGQKQRRMSETTTTTTMRPLRRGREELIMKTDNRRNCGRVGRTRTDVNYGCRWED